MFTVKLSKLVLTISACYLFQINQVIAQSSSTITNDTLRLKIEESEQIFLNKNLQLLAGRYNVKADSALIQQAKLWDNPNLATDQNVYSNNTWFEHGQNADGTPKGQIMVQLEFLVKTAGKRGKQIKIAQTNAGISQWQFRDLMCKLKAQLREDFYTLVQLELNSKLLQQELEQTDKLLYSMSQQLKAGNIAQKDLLRIQALDISLQQDAIENEKQLEDMQSELKTMLQITGNIYIKPVVKEKAIAEIPQQSIAQITDLARQNNPGYQLQKLQLSLQQQNLSLQKAMAVPDISVGPNYDLNSNYAPHYVGLGIGLPLPIFNRNQGNIKSAKMQVKQEETNMEFIDQQLSNEVMSAWKKLQLIVKLSAGKQNDDFYTNYEKLYNNIVESYKQRQIGLVEFIDYFNAYKETRQRQAQQELNIHLAKEELNLKIGQDIN
jgi:outer membrane protein, heavy metal efflux system